MQVLKSSKLPRSGGWRRSRALARAEVRGDKDGILKVVTMHFANYHYCLMLQGSLYICSILCALLLTLPERYIS
jgi:hypothetical protein